MKFRKVAQQILKIIKKAIYIIFISIMIFDVLYTVNSLLNPEKQLNIFGFEFLIADYKNTNPNISKGDLLIIKNSTEKNLNIGDTVAFNKAGKLITHQIYSIADKRDGKVYETKGTENDSIDNWTLRINEIEGKFFCKIVKIGYIVKLLQNWIILLIVIILFITKKRYDVKLEKKRNRRKKKKQEKEI